MHFTDTTGIGDVFPVMRGFQHHMMHMQHPGQGCTEFFNMLFMGMLTGWYPAERITSTSSGAREATRQ